MAPPPRRSQWHFQPSMAQQLVSTRLSDYIYKYNIAFFGPILYTAPFDFSEISDMLLVFNENVTRISVSIPIAANDEQFEPPEVFQADLSLVSPQHDSITIAPSVSSVTILDRELVYVSMKRQPHG